MYDAISLRGRVIIPLETILRQNGLTVICADMIEYGAFIPSMLTLMYMKGVDPAVIIAFECKASEYCCKPFSDVPEAEIDALFENFSAIINCSNEEENN